MYIKRNIYFTDISWCYVHFFTVSQKVATSISQYIKMWRESCLLIYDLCVLPGVDFLLRIYRNKEYHK